MRPLTDALPKELLPLGRRTALQHVVFELGQAGVQRIVFVVSPRKEPILRAAMSDAGESGQEVHFAVQTEMRGLGDAVLSASDFVPEGEPCIVALGDAVIAEAEPGGVCRRLLASASEENEAVVIAVHRVPRERLSRYGVVDPRSHDEMGRGPSFAIKDIVEKPSIEAAPSPYAVAARYRLPYTVFETLRQTAPDRKGEVQLTDAIRTLLRTGSPGFAAPLAEGEKRYDIGGFDSYYRAFVAFALADIDNGDSLRQELYQSIRNIKEPTVE